MSANLPLNIQLIISRLKEQVPALQIVEDGVALDSLESLRSFRASSAYVVLDSESGESDQHQHTQQVTARFAVVVAEVNSRPDELMAAARILIGATRNALIGWMPANREFRSCVWRSGKMLEHDQSVLLWIDMYDVNYFNTGN